MTAEDLVARLKGLVQELLGANPDSDTIERWANAFAAAATEITSLVGERDALRSALTALVNKLDECKPHIDSAMVMLHVHGGGRYIDPNYAAELEAARALASPHQEGTGT